MFEIKAIKNAEEYRPLDVSARAPFTQAWFYGEWQEAMHRAVFRFAVKKNSETIGFFQVIEYPLAFFQNFLYIPHGPVVGKINNDVRDYFLKAFRQKLAETGKRENAAFARFDIFSPDSPSGDLPAYFEIIPPRARRAAYFQPKYEWVLDIAKPESELLADMDAKTRYNIRLAEKKGVEIKIFDSNFEQHLDIFYDLLARTSFRNNFSLHPKNYYRIVLKNCEKNKNAFLVSAQSGGQVLAMNLILMFGETAYFLFGGSSDMMKNLMAPHLAQWRGITEAVRRGCTIYNFGGIDAGGERRSLEGVTRFKKGFGGRLSEYADSYDLILRPFWHGLYNLRKRWG